MYNDHKKIWNVIDKIAYINGISVSALARRAGLDSTAFNKSLRHYTSGKCRWPSSESISRVLSVMNVGWGKFSKYMEEMEVEDTKEKIEEEI